MIPQLLPEKFISGLQQGIQTSHPTVEGVGHLLEKIYGWGDFFVPRAVSEIFHDNELWKTAATNMNNLNPNNIYSLLDMKTTDDVYCINNLITLNYFSNGLTSKKTGKSFGRFCLGALIGAGAALITIYTFEGKHLVTQVPTSVDEVVHFEHPGAWIIGSAILGGILFIDW